MSSVNPTSGSFSQYAHDAIGPWAVLRSDGCIGFSGSSSLPLKPLQAPESTVLVPGHSVMADESASDRAVNTDEYLFS